jgi:K+-sensing histidine kinase KdpD
MERDEDHVGLAELVGEVLQETGREDVAVDVSTDVPAAAELTANRDALCTAVKSTLKNAIEHADSEVCVTVENTRQGYDVVVEDDGPGVSREQLAPVEGGTETNRNHGRGLGLWQLRWGVDALDGDLSFETSAGTTVRISVPRPLRTGYRNLKRASGRIRLL